MIRYRPTTHDRRFTAITVSVEVLDTMIAKDGFPFHVGSEGSIDPRLPWQVQAYHVERYCDRFAEISVDEVAQRAVARLSMSAERTSGRSAITLVDGLETLAVFKDLGIEQIEIEVPWSEAAEIESRLLP
jgi:hypothetical protein